MKLRTTIKFSDKAIPKYMYVLAKKDYKGKYSMFYSDDGPDNPMEVYIKLFNTEKEANNFKIKMEKTESWFKAREYKVIKLNTTLKKYKSKFVPLQYAINKIYS